MTTGISGGLVFGILILATIVGYGIISTGKRGSTPTNRTAGQTPGQQEPSHATTTPAVDAAADHGTVAGETEAKGEEIAAAEKELAAITESLAKEIQELAHVEESGKKIAAFIEARSRLKMYEKGRDLSEANANEYSKALTDMAAAGTFGETQVNEYLAKIKRLRESIRTLTAKETAAIEAIAKIK